MIDSSRRLPPKLLTGGLLLSLLLACIINGAVPRVARAEPRFGDSSWVAPALPAGGDPTSNGPRVAPPDKERGWETALRTPFRVVLVPFRLIGRGLEAGVNHIGAKYLEPKPKSTTHGPRVGLRVDVSGATSGVDNVGIGPAISWDGFPTDDAHMEASAAFALNDRRRARFLGLLRDRQPLSFQLTADYDFKPDRSYYGIGNGTEEADRAYYRLESTRVEGALRLGASPLRRLQVLAGYSGMSPGVGKHASPLLGNVFPDGTVPFGGTATQYFISGVAGDFAVLDDAISPSLGVHGRAELKHAAGLRGADPDYNQWLLEGRAYLPVFAKRRVLAFRAAYAGVDPTEDGAVLPFYRLIQSEGQLRFLGYSTQRFRDRQLILAHVEYRWAISHQVSALAIYQLGAVAPEREVFSLRAAKTSWGGGLRMGMREGSALRFVVGKGDEGLSAQLALRSDF